MRSTKILIIPLLVSLLLFQNCATIISTTKQNVTVTTKPSGSKVYVNEKSMGKTPNKIRVDRSDGAEIRVEKDGYKTHYEMLYPAGVNPLAYVSILFYFIPYYVDIATGAAYKLNKSEINVDLIRIPDSIPSSHTIVCDEVNLKFKAGDKLGSFYIKDKVDDIIYYEKSTDINASDLAEDVNNLLKSLNFDVPKEKESLFSQKVRSRFFLKAEIIKIKYDIIASNKYEAYAKYETRCELKVNWKIEDRKKDILYEIENIGNSVKFENGGLTAFNDAFENSFYSLMYDPEVYEILSKENVLASDSATFEIIDIMRPDPIKGEGAINKASESVVTISNEESYGSGVIVSSEGYIVTNYHVVEGIDKVQVTFKNGFSLEGKVVRFNEEIDLALVKVEGSGFSPLLLKEDQEFSLGADVYAIGTPADKGLGQSVTRGIIGGIRSIEDYKFIQTDVSINPGNSGGALIDKSGLLIGIVNAKLVGSAIEGIGFAIPAYYILEKLNLNYI